MRNMPLTSITETIDEQAADTVMMLALMLARLDRSRPGAAVATIADRTLGIVGFDQSARALTRRAAQGFGMRVLVHGLSHADQAAATGFGAAVSPSLDHLLAETDIVSLHGQPDADTNSFINARRLNQMKPDAYLINAAHGGLVDEQALIHALWFETIGGAGFWVAPETLTRLTDFQVCDNAIVLAHPSNTSGALAMPSASAFDAPAPTMMTDNIVRL